MLCDNVAAPLTIQIQGDGKDWADDVDGENGSYDYLMFVSSSPSGSDRA